MTSKKLQNGVGVLTVMVALSALVAIALIGGSLITTMISSNQKTNQNVITGQIITQAAYLLSTEVNTAGAFPVATTPLAWSGSRPSLAPTIGTANAVGLIPVASLAPKVDAWGNNFGYCTFTATSQSSPVFALISAGANGTFQTTCTQALSGVTGGDDGVRFKTVATIKQGVGGTLYYGDPVTNVSDLATLTSRAGETRLVKSVGLTYVNPTGNTGASNWVLSQSMPTVVENDACTSYSTGDIARNASGDLYNCKGGYWVRVVGGSITASVPIPAPVPPAPPAPTLLTNPFSPPNKIWTWGRNTTGQLGNGSLSNPYTVAQEATLATDWVYVSTSGIHTMAIKSNGTLWGWGDNDVTGNWQSNLGDGTTVMRLTPIQIGVATNWSYLCTNGVWKYSVGLKSDGTLWGWGNHASTDGVYWPQYSVPVQIGTGNTWSRVECGRSHVLAIKNDGTLWTWGPGNSHGEQGVGTTVAVGFTITQVGAANNWAKVSIGDSYSFGSHSAGIRSDGTLWTWGYNAYGELGDGTTADKSSPTQVGSLTNWIDVSAGNSNTFAIKSDGTLWGAGNSDNGKVLNNVNTFTQIGTATNWAKIYSTLGGILVLTNTGVAYYAGVHSYGQMGSGVSGSWADITTLTPVTTSVVFDSCSNSSFYTETLVCIQR